MRMQVKLSTVMVEVGLSYEEAEPLIEENKQQIQTFGGAKMREADVGFYVRKRSVHRLGSDMDYICLLTGALPLLTCLRHFDCISSAGACTVMPPPARDLSTCAHDAWCAVRLNYGNEAAGLASRTA
jgi:hypothetical protein